MGQRMDICHLLLPDLSHLCIVHPPICHRKIKQEAYDMSTKMCEVIDAEDVSRVCDILMEVPEPQSSPIGR